MDIKTTQTLVTPFAQKHGIELLVLFGSQAKGKTHPRSDIDLGYIASREFSFADSLGAATELSELLKRDDLEFVNLRKVSPLLKKIVADEGIVLYERYQGSFIQFKMYAFKLYVETKMLREMRYQSLKKFAHGSSQ